MAVAALLENLDPHPLDGLSASGPPDLPEPASFASLRGRPLWEGQIQLWEGTCDDAVYRPCPFCWQPWRWGRRLRKRTRR